MKHPTLTILLPTYNEAGNIIPLMQKILFILPQARILVVDDNSPDGTAGLVRKFIKTKEANHRVRLIFRTAGRGLTNSLNAGIKAAKSEIIAWMDCDFSHPPEVLPQLLDCLRKGADLALATRFYEDKRPDGSAPLPVLSIMINSLAEFCFGSDITDYTTGFLAAKRKVFKNITLKGNYGEYCIDFLVRAKAGGFQIGGIPYVSPGRRWGKTKTSPDLFTLLRHGAGYFMTILRLVWTVNLSHTTGRV